MSIDAPDNRQPLGSESTPRRSKRRIAKLVGLAILGIAAALAANAFFGPSPRLPQGVLTATADPDRAAGYRQQGEISGKALLAAHATQLQSNRNTQIAAKLTELLDDLASKRGTAGELPEHFYPHYIAPPAFDFVSELGAEKRVDGSQLMRHTFVVWQTPGDRTPREVIATVRRSLEKAGWKVPENDGDGENLRVTNDDQVVVVFPEDDHRAAAGETADAPKRMFIGYSRNMPAEKIHAAVRKMFENGADESALVMFQNYWHQHRDLVEEYFAERTPADPDSWLQLAHLRKQADPQAARDALLRASALKRILHRESPDSSMKKLAKELGLEEFPDPITREMIETLGTADLHEPGQIELTVHENQPAAIWLGNQDEQQSWLVLTAVRRRGADPEKTLRIQLVRLLEHGHSWSDRTGGDLAQTKRPVHRQHLRD